MKHQVSARDYARLSLDVYDPAVGHVPDWRLLEASSGSNGFYGAIYGHAKSRAIVVAYRGTDGLSDVGPDLRIGLSFPVFQYSQALGLFERAVNEHGAERVSLTGHSLGGALAALVAASKGTRATTFNAPGTNWMQRALSGSTDSSKLVHFRAVGDPVSAIGELVGQVVEIELGLPAISCGIAPPIVVLGCLIGQGAASSLAHHSIAQLESAIGRDRRASLPPNAWH